MLGHESFTNRPVTFLTGVAKCPTTSNLRERGFISHFGGTVHHGGEAKAAEVGSSWTHCVHS